MACFSSRSGGDAILTSRSAREALYDRAVMSRAVVMLCAVVVASSACGPDPSPAPAPLPMLPTASCELDGSVALDVATPFLSGGFTRVFEPAGTRYLNDHTLVRARDGVWHVFGITHTSMGMPQAERSFLHATAPSLAGPWREEPDALMSMGDEMAIWAPHVTEVSPGRWAMYYFPNAADGRIRRADSDDLYHWTRTALSAPGGRDPFLFRDGARWLLYSVGVSPTSNGRIVVSQSADLVTWSEPAVVTEDPLPSFGWGNLESPFVVLRRGVYYLFLTRTSESLTDYARTVALASTDPLRFAWRPVSEFTAHAAEVVVDGAHTWLTSGGWTGYVGDRWRGLSLAPLSWATCVKR